MEFKRKLAGKLEACLCLRKRSIIFAEGIIAVQNIGHNQKGVVDALFSKFFKVAIITIRELTDDQP